MFLFSQPDKTITSLEATLAHYTYIVANDNGHGSDTVRHVRG